MQEYYLITFESTHAAISTEKLLKPAEISVMPVPRFVSASCGISVRIDPNKRAEAEELFKKGSTLSPSDFAYYHVRIDDDGNAECDRLEM